MEWVKTVPASETLLDVFSLMCWMMSKISFHHQNTLKWNIRI